MTRKTSIATAAALISFSSNAAVTAFTSQTTTTHQIFRLDSKTNGNHNPCTLKQPAFWENQACSSARSSKRLIQRSVSTTEPPSTTDAVNGSGDNMPAKSPEGLYQIENEEQHAAFMAAHPKDLVVLKFYAPWCRACKGLAPKYLRVAKDKKYEGLPIIFGELNVQHNRDFVKSLGILALPSVHFYAGSDGLVENFPCGPSKIPILKRKLEDFVNENIDSNTMELKLSQNAGMVENAPCREEEVEQENGKLLIAGLEVSEELMKVLRFDVPYFKDFSQEEFDLLMQKATLQTFPPSSVIMRQGMPGKNFYVIAEGEVEISVKTAFEDPLTTPSSYLGAVVNRLTESNYFGERALITGEPRAASIRASNKTRCFVFDMDDIPESSVLSGKKKATEERLSQVDDKYGVDVYDIDLLNEQIKKSSMANQERGSFNNPGQIPDVDGDVDGDVATFDSSKSEDMQNDILPLLVRFKLMREAAMCFDYIMRTNPVFGDPGEMKRRSLLVRHLSTAQKQEFKDVFNMIDSSKDGIISLVELKKSMELVGGLTSDHDIREMISKSNPGVNGYSELTFDDFMGVMAEAEFYNIFTDTFNQLDKFNSGFVRAADLDSVLCGMRDLVSDDRKSLIDVEDKEMLVNYEQFSKMLLGASL